MNIVADFTKNWENWEHITFYSNIIKKIGNPKNIGDKAKLVIAYYKKYILSEYCGYGGLLKAISYLNVIIVKYPKETIFYIARATIYEHLSNYRSALDDCDRVLNIDPNCSEALYKKLKIMFILNCGDIKPILKKLQLVCPMYATKEKEINKYFKKKAK